MKTYRSQIGDQLEQLKNYTNPILWNSVSFDNEGFQVFKDRSKILILIIKMFSRKTCRSTIKLGPKQECNLLTKGT